MASHIDDTDSIADSDFPPIYTPSGASTDVGLESKEKDGEKSPIQSAILEAGSSIIIKSISTGDVITFQGGQVVMKPLEGHNSIRWQCVKNKGWFGFRDPASNMYLGYDANEELCCTAKHHELWENFSVEPRANGGYLLLMLHYDNWFSGKELRPVGIKVKDREQKLAVVQDSKSKDVGWQFIKV